jgi:putative nucleotidyltransferase with HDIG domain
MPFLSFLRRVVGWPSPDLSHEPETSEPAIVQESGAESDSDLIELVDEEDSIEDAWWAPQDVELVREAPKPTKTTINASTHERIKRALDDPDLELPQLPRVTQQALMCLRSEKLEYRELAKIVTQDQVLTAEILRVANSVAFRRMSEVQNVDTAFSRLGIRELRRILLATSMKSVMIHTGAQNRSLGRGLWQCSRVSAAIMEHVAPRVGVDPSQAYLIGLLHDIGRVAVLRVMHEMLPGHIGGVPREDFDRVCENWHEHLGQRLASSWGLPDPLPEVIGSHHRPTDPDHPMRDQRLLISLADVVCAMLNYAPYVPYDFFNLDCIRGLGIKDDADTRQWLATWPSLAASHAAVD